MAPVVLLAVPLTLRCHAPSVWASHHVTPSGNSGSQRLYPTKSVEIRIRQTLHPPIYAQVGNSLGHTRKKRQRTSTRVASRDTAKGGVRKLERRSAHRWRRRQRRTYFSKRIPPQRSRREVTWQVPPRVLAEVWLSRFREDHRKGPNTHQLSKPTETWPGAPPIPWRGFDTKGQSLLHHEKISANTRGEYTQTV